MTTDRINWTALAIEFFSIFIAVTMAFALDKWNENRRDRLSETKILLEIRHGLALDLLDMEQNINGHRQGIKACIYFRKMIGGDEASPDSLGFHYYAILRDYISIQNASGYESLKSKGLELIENDSLRLHIISLYDFHYQILEKLEENYSENQFDKNYFHPINDILTDHMAFDENGKMTTLAQPLPLSSKQKAAFHIYVNRIQFNRQFVISLYFNTKEKIQELIEEIDKEIAVESL
ncbi:MAG: hypothetical protein AAF135_13330 [Bacteroidota bacterium]